MVILQRLQAKGYTGGASILRMHLRKIRGPRKKPLACIRFESPPGQQCQCDWGHFGTLSYGNTKRKLNCMAVIECQSRLLYVEFTHSLGMMAFMRTLLNAFIFFGGTPKELVHDNLKTAVIERVGGIIRFNEDYLHFLRPFHITPYACAVADPASKGKIEKGGIHYVRYNFWPCRTFVDLDDVNRQAWQWLDQVANQRVHQTTGEVPLERFRAETLRPLPDTLPDTRDTATGKVYSDCRFKFDTNYYTTPHWLVGKNLDIKADNHTVNATYKDKVLITHPRSWLRREVIENSQHIQDLLRTRKRAQLDKQAEVFLSMGEVAKTFLEGLAKAGKNLNQAIKKLLILRDQHGAETVIRAMQTALQYRAYGLDYVENIVRQQNRTVSHLEPIQLKDQKLNHLHLQETDLLIYDAIALKKRKNNDDSTGANLP
jgi:transposase